MTSTEIRQSFLDFFKSKEHTIVRSSSLLPDAPNLLFTNAGMNQFVPIFLGQKEPDVASMAGAEPARDTRAADTQKCIRAGGKHNDLEDVGQDTYHHTFFEMLGNWSFGDYFKKEAIEYAWELLTQVWKFPKQRLYATVYKPGPDDPASFDQQAYDYWSAVFTREGLDPKVHIVFGDKKDNFWMMGETGPCGPCSEIHMDLTQQGDTGGALVNKDSSECIELWNLVFIQFNANPDGSYSDLPASHVDTGMGFERVASVMQCTKGFTDFATIISNYETDVFRPIFDELQSMSGKEYTSTLPAQGSEEVTPQQQIDVAFRVIADHIRTLSFAIADGIRPGNTDRDYVLRRILRRAVRYGRTLGFKEPFFYKLVEVVARQMGDAFPEIRERKKQVEDTIRTEEESFSKTLDEGIEIFEQMISLKERGRTMRKHLFQRFQLLEELEKNPNAALEEAAIAALAYSAGKLLEMVENVDRVLMATIFHRSDIRKLIQSAREFHDVAGTLDVDAAGTQRDKVRAGAEAFRESFINFLIVAREFDGKLNGDSAFLLYDTYGFPVDLTELMARERGLALDRDGFELLMEQQRERARKARKTQVVELSQVETKEPTVFVGFDMLETPAKVLELVQFKDQTGVILDTSACYAERGGQVGDSGELSGDGRFWRIKDTQCSGNTWLHLLQGTDAPEPGSAVTLTVNKSRRNAIQRHHTVTHLLHWALHEVLGPEVGQKGSYVGAEKLTFDFNSEPLTSRQVSDVEKLVNERILENSGVSWAEVPFDAVKNRKDVMQFFSDKYGDKVRVVQIGGRSGRLDGYSMELCGGTHTRATGEVGLFRIVAEHAISTGWRRIEAVAGLESYESAVHDSGLIHALSTRLKTPPAELETKIESLLAQQKALEKTLKAAKQREAAQRAQALASNARTLGPVQAIIENLGAVDGNYLQTVADSLKGSFEGVVVLGAASESSVALIATVSKSLTKTLQAGKIIQSIAPVVGGKGGGRPDNARGGGKDVAKLDDALSKAAEFISSQG